mmetsp:Transcript_68978/g.194528  ORF Transcript_68978/g.194528 Transcript_68978/m.194528 type:complete len:293 (-) Transcript_68978:49-927(-)
MDLGAFAEEVLDTVGGICGDAIVETHEQASHVLDALLRRPGSNRHELAAVFGVTFEQLERCCNRGREDTSNEVYANLCELDAVYTWNVLMSRINHAAHWREEFRDLQNLDEDGTDAEEEEAEDVGLDMKSPDNDSQNGVAAVSAAQKDGKRIASAETRAKARKLLAKHLDAPEVLKERLAQKLDDEIMEHCPENKDYTYCARSIAANFRRNTMLAAGYTSGRVPPQWIVLSSDEALATRMGQLQRRCLRVESLKDSQMDDETAEQRRQAWHAARGGEKGDKHDVADNDHAFN